MAKTYSITLRLTEVQKKFIDRAMHFHEAKHAGKGRGDMIAMRHFLQQKFGKNYSKREQKSEDLLNMIEEYKASELDDNQEILK